MPPVRGDDGGRGRAGHVAAREGMVARRMTVPRPSSAALVGAGLLGVLAWALMVPAPFLIDENNYLMNLLGLAGGDWVVPGTDGLGGSPALRWFDPWPPPTDTVSTPIYSTVPPWHALLAEPFLGLGWRGLVLLNVLGWLLGAWAVHRLVRRVGSERAAVSAALLLLLGTCTVEYAQGVWPQMLSLGLCAAAMAAARDGAEGSGLRPAMWAVGAGVLAGVACGVRYQNVMFAAGVGAALGVDRLLARGGLGDRLRQGVLSGGAYVVGLLGPLLVSAAINAERLGLFHPATKGRTYLEAGRTGGVGLGERLANGLGVSWARIVDYRVWPAMELGRFGERVVLPKDELTGVTWSLGVVKKSLTQSMPWTLLALAALAAGWLLLARRGDEDGVGRELRFVSWPAAAVLGGFALFGYRTAGLAWNMRYLLEVLPLLCVALTLAWIARSRPAGSPGALSLGSLLGASLAVAALATDVPHPQGTLVSSLPLLLGALLLVAVGAELLGERAGSLGRLAPRVAPALLAASVAWGAVQHLGSDLPASRQLRHTNEARGAAVASVLDDRPTLVAGARIPLDCMGPLLLERDVVVADLTVDGGRSGAELFRAAAAAGRRILLLPEGLDEAVLGAAVGGRTGTILRDGPFPVVELEPGS